MIKSPQDLDTATSESMALADIHSSWLLFLSLVLPKMGDRFAYDEIGAFSE